MIREQDYRIEDLSPRGRRQIEACICHWYDQKACTPEQISDTAMNMCRSRLPDTWAYGHMERMERRRNTPYELDAEHQSADRQRKLIP